MLVACAGGAFRDSRLAESSTSPTVHAVGRHPNSREQADTAGSAEPFVSSAFAAPQMPRRRSLEVCPAHLPAHLTDLLAC